MLPDSDTRPRTLEEVADFYGLSYRKLVADARAGRVEHVCYGRTRVMTREQERKLLDQLTVRSTTETELDKIRRRVNNSRRTGRPTTPVPPRARRSA